MALGTLPSVVVIRSIRLLDIKMFLVDLKPPCGRHVSDIRREWGHILGIAEDDPPSPQLQVHPLIRSILCDLLADEVVHVEEMIDLCFGHRLGATRHALEHSSDSEKTRYILTDATRQSNN